MKKIVFEGSFFTYDSLAHVNRQLALELSLLLKDKISIHPLESQQNPDLVAQFQNLAPLVSNKIPAEEHIVIRHLYPPFFAKHAHQKLILIQPWELSSIPAAWVEPIKKNVAQVWVPSVFVQNIFKAAGINNVYVVPNGMNPAIMNPEGPTPRLPINKRTTFLFVGGTIPRKGIDILLKAWQHTFTTDDDVLLIIKDMRSTYNNQTATEVIKQIQNKGQCAPLLYIDSSLTEEQMASLYRQSTCLLAPYRGEGFCLPALEAAACGCGVIATQGGPTDDFCLAFNRWSIPAKWVDVSFSEPTVAPAKWFEPDFELFCQLLKKIADNPDEIKNAALNSVESIAQEWTWQKAALTALDQLNLL